MNNSIKNAIYKALVKKYSNTNINYFGRTINVGEFLKFFIEELDLSADAIDYYAQQELIDNILTGNKELGEHARYALDKDLVQYSFIQGCICILGIADIVKYKPIYYKEK